MFLILRVFIVKKFFIIFIILGIIVFSYNNIWQTYKTYISVYQSFQSYLPTNEIETIMNKTIQGKEPFNNVMQQYMSEQVYNSLSLNQNINNKVRIINQVLDTNNSDIVYINFFTFTKNSLGYIVYINQIMAIKKHDQWYLLENLSSHQVNDSWYYKVGDAISFSYIAW